MEIIIKEYPTDNDWYECKRRALMTVGKTPIRKSVDHDWRVKALVSNHSVIRRLRVSFDLIGIPTFVATHLARHVHAQPYIKTMRDDRQDNSNEETNRLTPVNMIWDMNIEEFITIAHKRLCSQASLETRLVVKECCRQLEEVMPEIKGLLVPLCVYRNGICEEFKPCGRYTTTK